jgi:hypothetical protein
MQNNRQIVKVKKIKGESKNPIMKIITGSLLVVASIFLIYGCNGKGAAKKEMQIAAETSAVSDTGYTGIKKYMSGKLLVKEVTFKNGVREGLMKSFYQTGELRQSFWYRNGLREDSAKWYYMDGRVFRATPYKNDTINGIQQQYYTNGLIKARIGYLKGLRTTEFKEYKKDGSLIIGYPELVVTVRDDYRTNGIYRIKLELTEKSTSVKFYRGEFLKGVFDTVHYKRINTIKGTGNLDLRKTGSPKPGYVGVIAEILTNYGNNYLVYKKIDLPYNDLN